MRDRTFALGDKLGHCYHDLRRIRFGRFWDKDANIISVIAYLYSSYFWKGRKLFFLIYYITKDNFNYRFKIIK